MRGRRQLVSGVVVAAAWLGVVSGAGASSLVAAASPSTAGTPTAPEPQTVELALSQIGFAGNAPSQTLIGASEALAPQFIDALGRFAVCDPGNFTTLTSTPPACPAASGAGTVSFTAYVPSLLLTVSARGFIYRTGSNAVEAWVHVTDPVSFSVALPGTLTPGTATAGPSVSWDVSAAINFGVTADVTAFDTAWTVAQVSPIPPVLPRHRARRHRHPARHRRRPATPHRPPTRHRHPTRRRPHAPTGHDPHVSTATVPASVFASTGCPAGGAWPISATLRYRGGMSETLMTTVPCGAAAPAPTAAAACTPLLFLCLPASARPAREVRGPNS